MNSVGHFHYCFFERSETFIYHQLAHLKRYRPVGTSLIVRNLDEFHLLEGSIYNVGLELYRPGLQFLQPLRYFSLRLAAELLKREKVALLHAHFGTWGAYALPLKKSLKIPFIVTFYGQDVSLLPKRSLWRNRFTRLWKEADLILAEGPHMIEKLVKLGAPREKVGLQRIGIPVSDMKFRPPPPPPTNLTPRHRKPFCLPDKNQSLVPTALWASRMVEKKGLLVALKALKLLKDQGLMLKLRIIGNGPKKREAERFVKEKCITREVTFLDFLTYKEYLSEFENADFFIAPSHTSRSGETEGGAPTTIIEAQARGLPVVSTRHADISFVMPDNYPYLAREADPTDLARVIKTLLKDRPRWGEIAKASRKFVERFHDLRVTMESLENFYDHLLDKGY